jgi:hypothetical protein
VAILRAAAGLAQLVEHIIRNDGVRSSNLLSGTILKPCVAAAERILKTTTSFLIEFLQGLSLIECAQN